MVAIHHLEDSNHSENTRLYLQSLMSGQKPDIIPEFGIWLPVVKLAEKAFSDAKSAKQEGTVKALLESLKRMPKKYPGLKELLEEPVVVRQTTISSEPDQESLTPTLPDYAQLAPFLSSGACPELDEYVAFSRKASERAYDQFHQFCGLWLFSVIAGRRVSLEIKKKKFYTNLMLAQCATTSLYAKSFTAGIAKQMLYELGLGYTLAPNRITPQKLLSDMAGKHIPADFEDLEEHQKDRVRRRLGTPGQKGLLYDELGIFIQSMLKKQNINNDFVDLLLTFDECPDEFENSTITRGGEPIDKPYLPLLGNMTPANLRQNAKAGSDFWGDGFWARFSFIVAPLPEKNAPDPGPPQLSAEDREALPFPTQLLQSLRDWHERLGIPVCHIVPKMDKKGEAIIGHSAERGELPETACTIEPKAQQAWMNYDHALRQLCLKLPHEDFNGSYVRLAETAMRIAVLLASLSNDNHVEMKHWAKAQELTEILRANLHELYAQINVSREPGQLRQAEDEVKECVSRLAEQGKPVTERELKRYLKKLSSGQIRTALIDLVRTGDIVEQRSESGRTTRYLPASAPPEDS